MKRNFTTDYIKTNRKKRREEEIELHDKPINFTRIQKSKKAFKRGSKRVKPHEIMDEDMD